MIHLKGVGVTKSCDMPQNERTTQGEPLYWIMRLFHSIFRIISEKHQGTLVFPCQSHPFWCAPKVIHVRQKSTSDIIGSYSSQNPYPNFRRTKPYQPILLMVQKSHSQPPFGCRKPYKIMGYLPISTGSGCLIHQRYLPASLHLQPGSSTSWVFTGHT